MVRLLAMVILRMLGMYGLICTECMVPYQYATIAVFKDGKTTQECLCFPCAHKKYGLPGQLGYLNPEYKVSGVGGGL